MEHAAAAAILGRRTRITADEQRELAALVESDPDARVRSVALGALVHAAPRRSAAARLAVAARDPDRNVRRHAAELAPALGAAARRVSARAARRRRAPRCRSRGVRARRAPERDPRVICGARVADDDCTRRCARARSRGRRARARSAIPAALPVVLAACDDKPAVRRRAVLALAAVRRRRGGSTPAPALEDRDWQTRTSRRRTSGALRSSARTVP